MLHTIRSPFLTVSVKEKGAELQSILDRDGREYLWQGDPRYWPDRALNIFPYVARLTQGRYEMDGQTYSMDIHGLSPYLPFTLTEKTHTAMTLTLLSDGETRQRYPRDFAFSIRYELRQDTLEITFLVENRDHRTMYFGLGGPSRLSCAPHRRQTVRRLPSALHQPLRPQADRLHPGLFPGRNRRSVPPDRRNHPPPDPPAV